MEKDKIILPIGGIPCICRTLLAFENCDAVSNIVLVVKTEDLFKIQFICEKYNLTKLTDIVCGGASRQESVLKGFERIPKDAEKVLIHDGARPLVTAELINRLVRETEQFGACVAGMPVKDTIQMTNEQGVITLTPKRESLWIAQTPQAFEFSLAYDAYRRLMEESEIQVTDDAMVVGLYHDVEIQMIRGSYTNIKVTTPEDLVLAEAFLRKR